jgi:hemolysin activation/secretion protein
MLRRVRRLPGLSVDADTRGDPEGNGGVVLDLESSYKPVEGKLKLSNRGTREIGRNLAFAQVAGNGLFGGENSVGLYVGTSEESDKYVSGGLFGTTAIGARGTSARIVGGVSVLRLDADSGTEEHDRRIASLRITHPLRQDTSHSLTAWGAFALEDLDIGLDGVILREDRLRSIEAGAALSWRRDTTRWYASLELEQGITGLGGGVSTVNDPDDPRRADFSIARLRFVRVASWTDAWSLRWDAYGQYSPHVLPSTRRFKIGGNRIGRGFEAAAISGDRGVGNTLKLNRQLDGFDDWRRHTGLYGFYDIGTTWTEDSGTRESATSAGIGVSFRADWLSGHVEVAKPLTHADEDGRRDANVFAEIAMEF